MARLGRLTLYTLHSTLYTLHILRSPLHTLHSTLLTLHSTLHTLHFPLHTPHSTLSTPHCRLVTGEICTVFKGCFPCVSLCVSCLFVNCWSGAFAETICAHDAWKKRLVFLLQRFSLVVQARKYIRVRGFHLVLILENSSMFACLDWPILTWGNKHHFENRILGQIKPVIWCYIPHRTWSSFLVTSNTS